MRIKHIEVKNLFGVFDHSIPLNTDDRITIIYGPNGFGKTYTLTLINELFNPSKGFSFYSKFIKIPFSEIVVEFDDKSSLFLYKEYKNRPGVLKFKLIRPELEAETYLVPEPQGNNGSFFKKEPDWLQNIKKTVNVYFIHTERAIEITDEYWRNINKNILENLKDKKECIEFIVRLVNNRFVHKQMEISKQYGFVFRTSDGKTLRPENLSSGEQHILLLLYRLLFKVKPDSLILIDEPELSLHILWQQVFLKDLEEIIRLAGVDILVATHSPQIIHDRWDLAVELKDPRA